MTQEIPTLQVMAMLNEAVDAMESARAWIENVADLLFDKTSTEFNMEQMGILATISAADLEKLK